MRNFPTHNLFSSNVALPPKSPMLSISGFYSLPLGKVNEFPLHSRAASFQPGGLGRRKAAPKEGVSHLRNLHYNSNNSLKREESARR